MGSRAPRSLAERSRLVGLEQRRAEIRERIHVVEPNGEEAADGS